MEAARNDLAHALIEAEARELSLRTTLDEAERASLAGKEQFAEVQALLSRERQRSAELADAVAATENVLTAERERRDGSALEVKTAHLERDGERREQEAAALLNSTSWRLSAPWRSYRRMVSRLHRLLRGKKMNPLFDRGWYLQQYPDVNESEIDPYDHYLRHGAGEGRDPNPLFDTDWYLQQNPSVRQSGENPLTHFYSVGAKEFHFLM